MKALSVRQPWAQWIAYGDRTVEVRSRPTHHRGPLAICSSAQPDPDFRDVVREQYFPLGRLICVVEVVDCVPMTEEHFDGACFMWEDWRVIPEGGAWAWILANPRFLEPVPMKGSLNFWSLDDSAIRYVYECPACKAPDRDLAPVFGDAEGDEDAEIQYLRCASCGAEFHELTTGEFGYVRIAGDAGGI